MERHPHMQNGEFDMTTDVELIEVGEFGIGEGAIETLLTDEENEAFNEIIKACMVPADIRSPFTCGDERCGCGTVASDELTNPRVKLFGALAGVYSAMLLVNPELGKDHVAEMIHLQDLLASSDYYLGGHTDTTHAQDIVDYVNAFHSGQTIEVVEKSACGASDNLPQGIKNVATYGPRPAFTRLEKFLLGDYYDLAVSEQLIATANGLTNTIPSKLDGWRGGNLIRALVNHPDHIEILTDDGKGVHGHRGAKIVINRREGYTLDRRKKAELVAAHPLLSEKSPNAFAVDAWAIPLLAEPLAEYMATSRDQIEDYKRLIIGAIGHTQLGTGITLTKGTQGVVEIL